MIMCFHIQFSKKSVLNYCFTASSRLLCFC
nr:MAG TPA: hypothetical protein [Caudoviricetes sp.]